MNAKSIVKYPFEKNGTNQLLIGGILTLLSFLILPVFVIAGYCYEVIHNTINGNKNHPKFITNNIFRFGKKGFGVCSILAVYGVIWATIILISTYTIQPAIMGAAGAEHDPRRIYSFLFIVGITPILLAYVANASFILYATTDDIKHAFSIKNIRKILTNKKYFITNIILFLSLIIYFILNYISIRIFIIGQVFTSFLLFLVLVIISRALGTVGKSIKKK